MKKAIQLICVLLIVATLALPVSAAGFKPSVEQKGAPAPVEKDVAVTALVDLEKAPAEVKKIVEEARKVITDAKSLEAAVPTLGDTLKEMKADVNASDLVVRDLFYVKLDKDLKDGETKTVTFKAEGIEKSNFLMVMVFVDGQWVILDADKVEITKSGEVKVTFDVVGPVAFVTKK